MCVGTVEGKVELWFVGQYVQTLQATSRVGVMFGEITCVCMNDKGEGLIVTSSAAELVHFDLGQAWFDIRTSQDEKKQR